MEPPVRASSAVGLAARPLHRVEVDAPGCDGGVARVFLSLLDGRTRSGYRTLACVSFYGESAEDDALEFAVELEVRVTNGLPFTEVT